MKALRAESGAGPVRPGKPRRRDDLGSQPFPRVEALKQQLKPAMARAASIEKVAELSAIALAMHRAGAVADSYNTFSYAVCAALSLPRRQQEDALRRVRSDFMETGMDISCYEGLLRRPSARG